MLFRSVEQAEQLLDVGEVEAGGRLVEDVDAALLGHAGGQLEPLPLAAGQRGERLADAKLLRTSRVTTGSYNVCALDGRVVTPSLDDGRLTLLDSRGLRSAHVAPHAHDACIVVAA